MSPSEPNPTKPSPINPLATNPAQHVPNVAPASPQVISPSGVSADFSAQVVPPQDATTSVQSVNPGAAPNPIFTPNPAPNQSSATDTPAWQQGMTPGVPGQPATAAGPIVSSAPAGPSQLGQQPTFVSGSNLGAQSSSQPGVPGTGSSKKKKLLFMAAAVAAVLLLGGGYVFAFYLPNTPTNIYKTSLDHTARAYDKVSSLVGNGSAVQYKSAKVTSDFKYTSSDFSADGTLNAQIGKNNATAALNVDAAGQKIALNARTVTASGQTTPDLYVQVSGVKSLLDGYGLKSLDSLDGQWISVDHTLLESAAADATKDDSSKTPNLQAPTTDQVKDALAKVGTVNRQYIFTDGGSKAVLKNEKYLGKSTQDGRSVYGYQVGYDKANLKAYLKAVQSAVNDSSLNTWVKQATGKPASEGDLQSLLDSVDKAPNNYSFIMYVDAKTKLVDVLHFKDTTSSDYFEIAQEYTKGTVYPFTFKEVSTSDKDNAGTFTMKASFDSATDKTTLAITGSGTDGGSPFSFDLHANVTGSKDALQVTAPAGAKSATDIYQSLGFGDLLNDNSTSDSSASSNFMDDFSLTQ